MELDTSGGPFLYPIFREVDFVTSLGTSSPLTFELQALKNPAIKLSRCLSRKLNWEPMKQKKLRPKDFFNQNSSHLLWKLVHCVCRSELVTFFCTMCDSLIGVWSSSWPQNVISLWFWPSLNPYFSTAKESGCEEDVVINSWFPFEEKMTTFIISINLRQKWRFENQVISVQLLAIWQVN